MREKAANLGIEHADQLRAAGHIDPEQAFRGTIRAIESSAVRVTRVVQNGSLPLSLLVILGTVVMVLLCVALAATGFGILLVLWLIGGGGGGDVKLMGALGAWVGASLIMKVFFVSAVLIAVMACGVLVLAFFTHGFGHVKKRYMASGKTRQ